jgi:hypothetical protein
MGAECQVTPSGAMPLIQGLFEFNQNHICVPRTPYNYTHNGQQLSSLQKVKVPQ